MQNIYEILYILEARALSRYECATNSFVLVFCYRASPLQGGGGEERELVCKALSVVSHRYNHFFYVRIHTFSLFLSTRINTELTCKTFGFTRREKIASRDAAEMQRFYLTKSYCNVICYELLQVKAERIYRFTCIVFGWVDRFLILVSHFPLVFRFLNFTHFHFRIRICSVNRSKYVLNEI